MQEGIIDRLKIILDNSGLNQKQIAESLYVSGPYISRVLGNQIKLTKTMANYICLFFGYNFDWLWNGNEPMKVEDTNATKTPALARTMNLEPRKRGPKSDQEKLAEYVSSLSHAQMKEFKRHLRQSDRELKKYLDVFK